MVCSTTRVQPRWITTNPTPLPGRGNDREKEITMKNPHAVALGKLGGSATSERKAITSAENGRLGGRKPGGKFIDIDELIEGLKRAGMEAGTGIDGASSYHILSLAGGWEIWGYIPREMPEDDEKIELLPPETIKKLAGE